MSRHSCVQKPCRSGAPSAGAAAQLCAAAGGSPIMEVRLERQVMPVQPLEHCARPRLPVQLISHGGVFEPPSQPPRTSGPPQTPLHV